MKEKLKPLFNFKNLRLYNGFLKLVHKYIPNFNEESAFGKILLNDFNKFNACYYNLLELKNARLTENKNYYFVLLRCNSELSKKTIEFTFMYNKEYELIDIIDSYCVEVFGAKTLNDFKQGNLCSTKILKFKRKLWDENPHISDIINIKQKVIS
jgi:hypothetical protein